MAKSPWEMAAVGKEFSHQSALFAWAAMAQSFGLNAANDPLSYKVAGHAQKAHGYQPEPDGICRTGAPDQLHQLRWLHAIKNQGHGDKVRGNRSKVEGLKAGVFDMSLPVPTVTGIEYGFGTAPFAGAYGVSDPGYNRPHGRWLSGYHGLYIELKEPEAGKPSEIQLEFQAAMRLAGYAAEIAYGWEAARDVLLTYLGKA